MLVRSRPSLGVYHPCPAHHPLSEHIDLPEKRLEHRATGKRRVKCFYYPSFVVEGLNIGDRQHSGESAGP